MRVGGRWKLLGLATAGAALAAFAPGCALRPTPARPAVEVPQPEAPAPHVGTPYDIAAADSLLTILVYRGGALASAGHNHVIASHDLRGTFYVPADPRRTSFELHVSVATLTVDEAALRAQQPAADFPPDVSEGAKEGTRRNMLGPALLDAEHSPEIVLTALRLKKSADGGSGSGGGSLLARVQCTVRGQPHTLAVPVRYERRGSELLVSGEMPLRQSDLGLTPFSAMLGALQVQDEMRVSFRIVARAAAPSAQ